VRNDILQWVQAVEQDLGADDEEGDTQAVVDSEFDQSGHSRSHVGCLRAFKS
jgi:hypothetical protein